MSTIENVIERIFTHHDRLPIVGDAHADVHDGEKKGFALYIPHFHKIFGLFSLLNMLLYVTPFHHQAVEMLGTEKMLALTWVHVILSWSSFEFRIGRRRSGLYTIYREMQLHTIVFTMRSWAVIVATWYFGIENIVARAGVVLFWHIFADLATKFYGTPTGGTTIRRADKDGNKGYTNYGAAVQTAIWFMSFSQLVGSFMMICDTPNAVRNAMFVMTPVQVSAFLATLVRKNLVRSETSFVIYVSILLPIFIYHPWAPIEVLYMAAIQTVRFNFRVNKYLMWTTVALSFAYLTGDLQEFAATYLQGHVDAAALEPPQMPDVMWSRWQPASLVGGLLGLKAAMPPAEVNAIYGSYLSGAAAVRTASGL